MSPCRLSSSPESGSAAGLVKQLRARCSETLRIVRWLGRLVHDSRTDFMFTLEQERTSFKFILISYIIYNNFLDENAKSSFSLFFSVVRTPSVLKLLDILNSRLK